MLNMKRVLGLIVTLALLVATVSVTVAGTGIPELRRSSPTGNVIFIHPDGAGPNHWAAARIYWYGPDALSPWDTLPQMAAYRGHMADILTGTSNGGATTHAFGYKVEGPGSLGKDGVVIAPAASLPSLAIQEASCVRLSTMAVLLPWSTMVI